MISLLPQFLKIKIGEKRVFGLDIVRCFAILTVVLGHSYDLIPGAKESKFLQLLPFPDGVSVFFVLSGFLIGGILIKTLETKKYSFSVLLNFWKRRWLRTLPNYFLVLIIIIAVTRFVTGEFNYPKTPLYFIFFQNFNWPHPHFFDEAWSLSIEEWFYFIVPLLVFIGLHLFPSSVKKSVLIVIFVVIIFTIMLRYYRYLHMSELTIEIWAGYFRGTVLTRLDNIVAGVFGAYLAHYHKDFWVIYKNQFLTSGILLLLFTAYIPRLFFMDSSFYWCNLSFIFAELGILLCFPFFSQVKTGAGKVYKFVTYTSLISYSMYLVHGALLLHLIIARIHFLQQNSFAILFFRYTIYWITIYIFSILQYKYFEQPILSPRNKKVIGAAGNSFDAKAKKIMKISKAPI